MTWEYMYYMVFKKQKTFIVYSKIIYLKCICMCVYICINKRLKKENLKTIYQMLSFGS